ncbi:secreted RxLR effector protein 161-like [Nicotiana sylvestris]|uniref:secreted RxLR effector protein 161-like n=1 Tax=Nicotiana sylvestris TaxID=4096 RepID=UPI00388CDFDE
MEKSIAIATKLDIDEHGSSIDQKLCKVMIGSLLYLTAGRPDIVFSVGLCTNFNLVGYDDVDYAGFLVDRKSTSGMAHFLGSCLVSWATKKHNSVALSTAEAEYVVAASCCAQLLWIK